MKTVTKLVEFHNVLTIAEQAERVVDISPVVVRRLLWTVDVSLFKMSHEDVGQVLFVCRFWSLAQGLRKTPTQKEVQCRVSSTFVDLAFCDMQINYPWALSEDGLLQMLVQRRNITIQHILKILEETAAADPGQFRLCRQKRLTHVHWKLLQHQTFMSTNPPTSFLKSSNFWEEDCQAQHMYNDKSVKFYTISMEIHLSA